MRKPTMGSSAIPKIHASVAVGDRFSRRIQHEAPTTQAISTTLRAKCQVTGRYPKRSVPIAQSRRKWLTPPTKPLQSRGYNDWQISCNAEPAKEAQTEMSDLNRWLAPRSAIFLAMLAA